METRIRAATSLCPVIVSDLRTGKMTLERALPVRAFVAWSLEEASKMPKDAPKELRAKAAELEKALAGLDDVLEQVEV